MRPRPAPATLRAAHARVSADPESGMSMIELFVAMILMTICGAIFTTSVVTLFRAANHAQAITTSAQQENQAYQTLDRTVRYANALSTPGQGSSGDWYVEARRTDSGSQICTQLRVDIATQQLQRRTWTVSSSGAAGTPTTWLPLASSVTNGSASSTSTTRPFVMSQSATGRQVLTVTMLSVAGTGNDPVTSRSGFALTAVNGTIVAPTDPVCQQVSRP